MLEIFGKGEVTASPIYEISDIVKDEHFREREILVDLPDKDLGEVPMHNIIPRLTATPGTFRLPAPELGEHTGALLGELGIDADRLRDLMERGVV